MTGNGAEYNLRKPRKSVQRRKRGKVRQVGSGMLRWLAEGGLNRSSKDLDSASKPAKPTHSETAGNG